MKRKPLTWKVSSFSMVAIPILAGPLLQVNCPATALPPSVPPCPFPPRQHLFTYSKQYKEIANIDKIYHPSYNLMNPNKEPVSWKNLTPADRNF
jgi:hypothetical protein